MSSFLRIDQILPSFSCFDAIGAETCAIRDMLREQGYASDIFTEQGVVRGQCRHVNEYGQYAERRILIHHFSIGSFLPYHLMGLSDYIVTRYHNITPARYFPHNLEARSRCLQGREQLPLVEKISQRYWPVSRFNAHELGAMTPANGKVLPLLRDYERLLHVTPCAKTRDFLQKDPRKTILFVGRVVAHKSHHDLLFFLKEYQKQISPHLRLICVGGLDPYYARTLLKKLIRDWQLKADLEKPFSPHSDVIFTGPVSDAELVSYYRHADAFVCMSEHEGFCVPLVEAMSFQLPILAHKAAAVPETLGSGGLLVDKKDVLASFHALYALLNDASLRERYRQQAALRARDFVWPKLKLQFLSAIEEVVGNFSITCKEEGLGEDCAAAFSQDLLN